ncbi:MAG TPA: adenylate/guanylate cyclase domain-containing protein [Terriglobia bacterium]|jgi:adenylate cyclase
MKYRTKLRVGFLCAGIGVNVISLIFLYQLAHRYLLNEFRSKVLSIASTTATAVDGDLHASIRTRADEDSPPYISLRSLLRRIRDRNRNDGNYVKYIYTLRPLAGNANNLGYVVDPEEDLKEHAHVGDVFPYPGEKLYVNHAYVDQDFFTDKTGTWLSGYAPIRDSAGMLVAIVEVDISANNVLADLRPLLWAAAGSVVISLILGFGVTFWLSDHVAQPLVALRATLERIGKGDLDVKSDTHKNDEFGDVTRAIDKMVDGLREREMVKTAFARYVSQQVMESIVSSGQVPVLHGDRRRITALFSDIRGFTTISETRTPEDVVELLNEYFRAMVDIVFRHHGTLDKFMGDGLMAIFGAPAEDPDHEKHAVLAAIEMQSELRRLSVKWEIQGRPKINIGIGINSGHAIVGNIGSEARMEYTAIGDTVNIASRLETATKEFAADILISEFTHDAVRGHFEVKTIGDVHVKGRAEPIKTYAVLHGVQPGV